MATLYTGAAFADGTTDKLRLDVSLLVADDTIGGIWFDGATPTGADGAVEVDASGTTIVPGLVDCHNHLTLPGGANWLTKGDADGPELEARAEEAGGLLARAGIRWVRDTGSPRRDGSAVSLRVRDRWAGRRDRPHVRSAGTWLAAPGVLSDQLAIHTLGGDELMRAVEGQLEDGADLVKLYLDGLDPERCPFDEGDVTRVVRLAHARGAKVASHANGLTGCRVGAAAGVDSIEHGFVLDEEIVSAMVENGVRLVSTLGVLHSVIGFGSTTSQPRFAGELPTWQARLGVAEEAVMLAWEAGVPIAAGSDAGGGSVRHGLLAWEVEALVRAGMPAPAALAAATWQGGDLIGDPEAGRIRVGGPSDVFFVQGDPLTEPGALWRIWRVL